ncbi:MAG: hypothetical protein H3C31_03265 [Brumimicrobium sp.]|nr:hypothetical protein [Brumimicrobium sp.]MCO5268617.1 hypothetical protein [Brumimicrobium sp.]
MKNVKLILLAVIAMLFLGTGNMSAQEKSTVIIRVYEEYKTNSHLAIISPDGTLKSIDLKNMKPGNFYESDNNLIVIQSEIDNWKKQGFKVDGISNTTAVTALITTIILSKEE